MVNPFTTTLLRWYEQHGRSLPWRATHDPYAIWLSEIILQQTRIEQGLPYWERFMQRFPTVDALAEASEDEVLRLWQGLGYYSRARNLHEAARQVVAQGGFPQTYEGLRALKGVGDYTAAAIGAFAFGLPVAAVDGNVYRVLARHFGIDAPIDTTQGKRLFTELAQSLLPPDRAADFNQAMMDFGATCCTPNSPQCASCPLLESCEAWHSKRISELPVKLRKATVKNRHLSYIYIRCKGEIAIRRRPSGDIWQGLWEVPLVEGGKKEPLPGAPSSLPPLWEATSPSKESFSSKSEASPSGGRLEGAPNDSSIHQLNTNPLLTQLLKSKHVILLKSGVRHVLTHRILLSDFYLLEVDERPPLPDEYIWIHESSFDDYAKPRLMEMLMETLSAYRI